MAKHMTSVRIDNYLDYLLHAWESVPSIAAEWGEWDPFEQMAFEGDWVIKEDRLFQLASAANHGVLSIEQRRRFNRLQRLVELNRPLLDQMFATPVRW